jgi:hypothetical protein
MSLVWRLGAMFDELDGGKGRISVAKLDAGLAKLDKAAHRRSFEAKRALCACSAAAVLPV